MRLRQKGLASALLVVALFCAGCEKERTEVFSGLVTEEAEMEETAGGFGSEENQRQSETEIRQMDVLMPETEKQLYIYVCGAVQTPGVYSLREGSRVYEAIELAGGFSGEADTQWLNQAELLQDGQKLYVFTKSETAEMEHQGMSAADRQTGSSVESGITVQADDGKVNLNTADKETLMTLPGIGEAKAEAVIQYRTEHGAFQSIEEIQNISGIKEAVFSKIKDRITV